MRIIVIDGVAAGTSAAAKAGAQAEDLFHTGSGLFAP